MKESMVSTVQDKNKFFKLLLRAQSVASLMFLAAHLGGCSKTDAPIVERPVSEFYDEGLKALKTKQYKKAAKNFDELERQHPYSSWAGQALLMSCYASFQAKEYDKAIHTAENYIQLHPGSKDAAYAYYMIAVNYYVQIASVNHDQKITEQAEKALTEVIRRFPGSEYARDAQEKMILVRNHLAGKQVNVACYYLKTKRYLSAINRLQIVIQKYQDTIYIEEAFYRLVEAYLALGIKEEAIAVSTMLNHNYPSSQWSREAQQLIQRSSSQGTSKTAAQS